MQSKGDMKQLELIYASFTLSDFQYDFSNNVDRFSQNYGKGFYPTFWILLLWAQPTKNISEQY